MALGAGSQLVAVDAESARGQDLADIPTATLESLESFDPTLVLLPAGTVRGRPSTPASHTIEMQAHQIDEVAGLHLAVGSALGRAEEAHGLVRESTRALATLGAEAFGQRRPRLAALLELDPLEIAGDHSFSSDLIELAGGENVSHGIEEPRLLWSRERLREAAPELVVRVSPAPLSADERRRTQEAMADVAPVGFLVLAEDPLSFQAALPAARALRELVISLPAP